MKPNDSNTTGGVGAWLARASFWLGWPVLLGIAGPGTEAERSALAIGCLAIAIAATQLQAGTPRKALLAPAALLLALVPTDLARALAYPLLGMLTMPRSQRQLHLLAALSIVSIKAFEAVPAIGTSIDGALVALAERFVVQPPSDVMGPTTTGSYLLLSTLAAVAIGGGRRALSTLVLAVVALVLWVAQFPLFATLFEPSSPYWGHHHPLAPFDHLLGLAALLALVVSAAVRPKTAPSPQPSDDEGAPRKPALAGALVLLVGAVLGQVFIGSPSWGTEPNRNATFVNHGGLDWERPHPSEVGAFSGGMFGLFPKYLERAGWQTETVLPADLTETLEDARGVLVMINCPIEWDATQRDSINAFVERGGGLLILGDHTDIFGCAKGFNTLLADYGIEFLFDSAYFQGDSWQADMQWSGFGAQPSRWSRDSGIAVGASLALTGPGFPIVVGRYGFSDHGIRENLPGSFLGNYKHDQGEQLGDVAVVAGAYAGAGQIRVFGDTSVFQNGSVTSGFGAHALPTMEDLARPRSLVPRAFFWPVAWGVTWLLFVLGVGMQRQARLAPWLLAGLVCGGSLLPAHSRASDPTPEQARGAVLIDDSHLPRIGSYGARWNSPWPLTSAALRTGLDVYEIDHWNAELLEGARALGIVAPTLAYTPDERAAIHAFANRGGVVILSASGEDAGPINEILRPLELAIKRPHQGNVPKVESRLELAPHLMDASALAVDVRPDDVVLFSAGSEVYGLARPVGAGWFIVIGDTRYFSTENVEGMQGYSKGNVRFLLELMVEYLDGSLDPPSTTLPDPVSVDQFGNPE